MATLREQAIALGYDEDLDQAGYWTSLEMCGLPRDFGLLPVGAPVEEGDIYFDFVTTSRTVRAWVRVPDQSPTHLGCVEHDWVVHARKYQPLQTVTADKWSCRHKRMPADKQCPVCAFMGRRTVD